MVNPCYDKKTGTDCPRRKPGCGATCPEWARYVEARDAEYDRRYRARCVDRHRISNFRGRDHQEHGPYKKNKH